MKLARNLNCNYYDVYYAFIISLPSMCTKQSVAIPSYCRYYMNWYWGDLTIFFNRPFAQVMAEPWAELRRELWKNWPTHFSLMRIEPSCFTFNTFRVIGGGGGNGLLATSMVSSWWLSTCNSAQSLWLYSAAALKDQAASTMTWCSTQSYYPDTEPTCPWPSLI